MKKKHLLLGIFLAICVVVFFACKKKKTDPDNNSDNTNTTPLEFVSLKAAKDTTVVNEQTTITATANGSGLTYAWDAPIGILNGSGKTVTFVACCEGDHPVTCTITDSNGKKAEKSVNIFANP